MTKLRGKLTYANVMATIAVFIALGGSAYAATQLKKNSVGSKQLKKNSITAAKIKNNAVTTAKIKTDAVTGVKVNESTLGAVPIAESLTPLEATHLVGASGQPAFEGGSINVPGKAPFGYQPVGFYKDHEGIVHLQGFAKVGSGTPAVIFTLPPGFRPASGKLIIDESIKEGFIDVAGSNLIAEGIDLSGKVLSSAGKSVVLDGITFRAES